MQFKEIKSLDSVIDELRPYFQKGLADKEIAKIVKKPSMTIRMYRSEYEKELFSKIAPKKVEEKVVKEDVSEPTAAPSKSKKELAFEYFDQGKDNQEVISATGLSYNSVTTYRYLYSKQNSQATPKETCKSTALMEICVGMESVNITVYDDGDCEWINKKDLMKGLKSGLNITELNIPPRYAKTEKVNGKDVELIDLMYLPKIAEQVRDHKFTQSIMKCLTPDSDNIFMQIGTVVEGLENISQLVDSIDALYDEVQAYDKLQCDILHAIEKEEYTEDELLNKASSLKELRKRRRNVKNVIALSKSIKNSMSGFKIKPFMVSTIAERLNQVSDDLYQKKYNPRYNDLSTAQRQTVDVLM